MEEKEVINLLHWNGAQMIRIMQIKFPIWRYAGFITFRLQYAAVAAVAAVVAADVAAGKEQNRSFLWQ